MGARVAFKCFLLTFRSREVDHVAIRLEHVDLLNRLDRLHVHLLERRLQLLVVGTRVLMNLLDLSPGSTLATANLSEFHHLFEIVQNLNLSISSKLPSRYLVQCLHRCYEN